MQHYTVSRLSPAFPVGFYCTVLKNEAKMQENHLEGEISDMTTRYISELRFIATANNSKLRIGTPTNPTMQIYSYCTAHVVPSNVFSCDKNIFMSPPEYRANIPVFSYHSQVISEC